MLFKRNETMPQFADRFLRIVAFALCLMSVSYGAGALIQLLSPEGKSWLKPVRAFFGLGAAAIVLIPFLQLMQKRFKAGKDCKAEPEGYISEVYAKSTIMAFSVVFIGMVLIEPIVMKLPDLLPPAFYFDVLLSATMATLGINFFIKVRESEGEDDDFDDDFEIEGEPKA